MIRRISTAIMLVAALVVAGCATGPKFSTIHQTLPSLAPDQGRIYFYRQAIFFW